MRVLVSWLRELVPVRVGIDELADALTRHGFEVAAVDAAPEIPGRTAQGPDAVLDLEITTNRPDCLSVLGIAREVSAIFGDPLHRPPLAAASAADAEVPVTIEEAGAAGCPRYAASVADVRVAPSPAWMAARLEAAGVRPINAVVDVTNYVMLELGHPMHAFDLDRLAGRELRVRPARAGEAVRTLDGEERTLRGDMLVIADAARAQAVAGVMGGADSEVTAGTARVALESAWFDPVSVRRTSRRLALSTDASYRFERGADIDAPVRAMRRAHALLTEIGAGSPRGGIVDRYATPRAPVTVGLRHARIRRVLGIDVARDFIPTILERLGFGVAPGPEEAGGATWRVTPPGFRVDVSREIDLIEEVARHHGYHRLPSTFPPLRRPPAPPGAALEQRRLLRRVLTAGGCSEAITYGFIEEAAAKPFVQADEDLARLKNPLSEKFAVLRPSLVPGLLDAVVYNRRRGRRDVRLFELGRCFTATHGESAAVAVVVAGPAAPEHWNDGRRWQEGERGGGRVPASDFYDVAGIVEGLLDAAGIEPSFEAADGAAMPWLEAGRSAVVRSRGAGGPEASNLGYAGQLAPAVAAARGLPGATGDALYVAELDLEALARAGRDRRRFTASPPPRFPAIVRDVAIAVDRSLPAAAVRDTIRAAAPDSLVDVRAFDRYEGAGIAEGQVSLAFRLTFRRGDRTLTDTEVQRTMQEIGTALRTTHQATFR